MSTDSLAACLGTDGCRARSKDIRELHTAGKRHVSLSRWVAHTIASLRSGAAGSYAEPTAERAIVGFEAGD